MMVAEELSLGTVSESYSKQSDHITLAMHYMIHGYMMHWLHSYKIGHNAKKEYAC